MTHTCLSTNGQSGSSMWDASNAIRAILTGKVRRAATPAPALALQ
jgi:hypothetical protein